MSLSPRSNSPEPGLTCSNILWPDVFPQHPHLELEELSVRDPHLFFLSPHSTLLFTMTPFPAFLTHNRFPLIMNLLMVFIDEFNKFRTVSFQFNLYQSIGYLLLSSLGLIGRPTKTNSFSRHPCPQYFNGKSGNVTQTGTWVKSSV